MKEPCKASNMFRMARFKCYFLMLVHQAPWAGWVMLAIVAGLTVTGFILSPWLGIAALGFDAFIIVMVMSFVIFAYGFSSITGVNMMSHCLKVSDGSLSIEFEEGNQVTVPLADIEPYLIYPGGVIIPVKGPREGWLWLPPKAFDEPSDFQNFLKCLYEGNSKQEP